MNAIRPIARTEDTVTLRASDYDALIAALEDAEDTAALFAADAREEALGRVEARADHLPVELVMRLLDGEPPVRIWREHRDLSPEALAAAAGVSPADLAEIEAGRAPGNVATFRSLAGALGVAIDDVVGPANG